MASWRESEIMAALANQSMKSIENNGETETAAERKRNKRKKIIEEPHLENSCL